MEATAEDVLTCVLVADPAPAVRARLSSLLLDAGAARVTEAVNGGWSMAFVALSSQDDLATLDALLAQAPLAPVVALLADPAGSALEREALRKGAFAVLRKPLRVPDVRAVVAEAREDGAPLVRFA